MSFRPENDNESQEKYWDNIAQRVERYTAPPTGLPTAYELGLIGRPTSRAIEEVANIQGFSLNDFLSEIADKTVLDIGGGLSNLDGQARSYDVNAHCVSIDVPETYKENDFFQPHPNRSFVAGIAQVLPFQNETFDIAVSTYALPWYVNASSHLDAFMNEALRVLKPSGKFFISPLYITGHNDAESSNQLYVHFFTALKNLNEDPNYTVSFGKQHDRDYSAKYPDVAIIEKL